jgi:hypothetical protein
VRTTYDVDIEVATPLPKVSSGSGSNYTGLQCYRICVWILRTVYFVSFDQQLSLTHHDDEPCTASVAPTLAELLQALS